LQHNVHVLGLMDEQERTPLHVAAQAGHTECIRVMLKYGAQAETVYAEHAEQPVPLASALHSAAANGNADALKMILAASGSNMVNAVDSFARTPLHLAALNGHAECVEVWFIVVGVM
jgi:ankyrin repeat protein